MLHKYVVVLHGAAAPPAGCLSPLWHLQLLLRAALDLLVAGTGPPGMAVGDSEAGEVSTVGRRQNRRAPKSRIIVAQSCYSSAG